jgi:hypothetical protein
MRWLVVTLMAAVGAVWVAGCGGGIPITQETLFQNKQALHPADFRQEGVELETTRVTVADGVELDAWHFRKQGAQCTVLYFGGQGFHMVLAGDFVDRFLGGIDADLMMSDYRGYGRSGGEPTVETMKADALEVYGAARERADNGCIVAHGHSMGSFVATWLATKREVAGVVLENPATNAEEWAGAMVPWYLDLFISFDIGDSLKEQDNLALIDQIEVPLLIVAGADDPITPPSLARKLFKRARAVPKHLEVIPEGGHNGLIRKPAYLEAYRNFLSHLDR